ncbi:MAG: C40 family peptidase [Firmicutes bacterium]|nr:C40 family peptidase [Bacillota bacterium]
MKLNIKRIISLGLALAAVNCYSALAATGYITDTDVNVRYSPDGEIFSGATIGESFEITGATGEWYQIDYYGQTGYINKAYITTDAVIVEDVQTPMSAAPAPSAPLYGIVQSGDGLNLRSAKSESSSVIKTFEYCAILNVLENDGQWVKVCDANGATGYVSAEFLKITSEYPQAQPASSNSSRGQEVIDYAQQFLGTPYVYGGNSLTSGVDCSGFTSQVYNHFGISLHRVAADQAACDGVYVDKEDLQPGDIIYFTDGYSSYVSHVGLYYGDGKYIHSTDGYGNGICISNLYDSYALSTYAGAKRVLN